MSERDDIIEECARIAAYAARIDGVVVHTAAHGPLCSAHTPGIIADKIRTLAEPVERIPEAALRSMLKAYETAALDAWRAFYRASNAQFVSGSNTDAKAVDRAQRTARRVDSDADVIRCALARWLECPEDRDGFSMGYSRFSRDYEARLSGQRPLDAPPMEEP